MSAPELIAGSVVAGKYTIRSLRLHGGAAATYRAVAAKNREVVLKIFDPAILSFPEVLKTLAQHQSIMAKLAHEQVVAIIDSGTEPNSGAPFTVTDCESLPSLAQSVDRAPLSASGMVALVHSLARAIDLLHANGIVSLSLHPGNVFVDPVRYDVRVADFGANLIRTAIPAPEKAGRWMPWLAPEQLKGQAPAGQAVDIFALGLIAFFAVTGKPYWRSSQLKAPDTAALRREILGERMPVSVRASDFSITLNPAVDTVFARALAFRPADRYATAREFAVGLEAALSGRSIAEVDAARFSTANVAAASGKASAAGPAAQDASPVDAAPGTARMAPPPPRKMLPRATMVGMGAPAAAEPSGPSTGPRRPLTTMLGMGEAEMKAVASAKNTAPAAVAPPIAAPGTPPPLPRGTPIKTPGPSMATAPAKVAAPTTATPTATARTFAPATAPAPPTVIAPAKAFAPATGAPVAVLAAPVVAVGPARSPAAMPVAPAKPPPMPVAQAKAPAPMPAAPPMFAEPPTVAPPAKTTQRGLPPALPMAPPPAQLEEVLARFEAGPRVPSPATAFTASPEVHADVAPAPAAWQATSLGDFGGERVETGVAVIGADIAGTPKKPRLRWIASALGLLVLMGGGAFALSGRTSGAKATATPPRIATEGRSASAEPPGATGQVPVANEVQPVPEEARTGAALEPVAPGTPAPAVQEPQAAEPAAPSTPPTPAGEPAAESNTAAQPISAPGRSAPGAGATAPRSQPSNKPCGKFLKRCK